MDKRHFDQLVEGVREMKRHMAGKSVRGARTTEPPATHWTRQGAAQDRRVKPKGN